MKLKFIILLLGWVFACQTQYSYGMDTQEIPDHFNLPHRKNVKNDFDIIIIGGGPIGLSAAYNCAKAGKKVILFERFNFFNQSGSSNDLVRMFRTMYTEDFMADLGKASISTWKELEKDAAEELIWMTGLLNFGDPKYEDGPEGNLMSPVKNLERLGMPYRTLTAEEIMKEYPLKNLPSHFQGIFAPDNGCINVPKVLRALHRLSLSYGAELVPHAHVSDLKVDQEGISVVVKITSGDGESFIVNGKRGIITCGAYTNEVLKPLNIQLNLNIWEMVYGYYATDPGPQGTLFPSMWFQFLDHEKGDPSKSNLFYGFPTVPWGLPNTARIAVDNAVNIIKDPSERKYSPAPHDLEITSNFVKQHCVNIDSQPNYCGACLQTNVPDNMYILDYLPSSIGEHHKNVAIFTAGWAFKFVPLIGKVLKELIIDGRSSFDISHFNIEREGVIVKEAPLSNDKFKHFSK